MICRLRRRGNSVIYLLLVISAALLYCSSMFLFEKFGLNSPSDITDIELGQNITYSRPIKNVDVKRNLLDPSSAQTPGGWVKTRGREIGHVSVRQGAMVAGQIFGDTVAPLGDGNKTTLGARHIELRQRCESIQPWSKINHRWSPRFKIAPLISTNHQPKILFCPLAKVGSTFFTRYMMNLKEPGPMKSPYVIRVEDAKQSGVENFKMFKNETQKLNFLDTAFKVVFCRNPYWRLFSAYIDKLYSPNPYYWKSWGKLNTKHKLWVCSGAATSFPNFVDSVVHNLYRKDMHIIPMSALCKLCEVRWDFVGTMEDSVHDIDSLSRLLNVTASFQHAPGYRLWSALDVIRDSTKDVFTTWRNDVTKCMTMYDVGRIIWRKLQIRGFIYNTIPFPFQEEEMKSMDADTFQRACAHASERSTNMNRLKSQKVSAFSEAYRMLKKSQIQALSRVYSRDIFLLQYPKWPLATGDKYSNGSDILNWRKPWGT